VTEILYDLNIILLVACESHGCLNFHRMCLILSSISCHRPDCLYGNMKAVPKNYMYKSSWELIFGCSKHVEDTTTKLKHSCKKYVFFLFLLHICKGNFALLSIFLSDLDKILYKRYKRNTDW